MIISSEQIDYTLLINRSVGDGLFLTDLSAFPRRHCVAVSAEESEVHEKVPGIFFRPMDAGRE